MYKLGSQFTIQAALTSQDLTISRSSRTAGSPLESVHFVLAVGGGSDFYDMPISIRFLHQDWGNPAKGPIIGIQKLEGSDPILLVDEFVSFDHLDFVQRAISEKTISKASIDYFGHVLPQDPENGFEQRPVTQIILS